MVERVNVGPRRVLSLDEQLEVARLHRQGVSATELARRFGVSRRTVFRYSRSVVRDTTTLRVRLRQWAKERQIRLTRDDLETLVLAIETTR